MAAQFSKVKYCRNPVLLIGRRNPSILAAAFVLKGAETNHAIKRCRTKDPLCIPRTRPAYNFHLLGVLAFVWGGLLIDPAQAPWDRSLLEMGKL